MTQILNNEDLLLVRLRVENFVSAYERCLDDDDLERWPDFFTEDGVYSVRSRENWEAGLPIPLMTCKGRPMMKDRVVAHRDANIYAPHVNRHFHSGLQVDLIAEGLRATSNYLVVQTLNDGDTYIYQAGRCIDHLVETDEGLLLKERLVVADAGRIQTLMVTPI
ncbi:hypothetical protein AU184_26670 [Mycolicibacterium novocastrense]|uniref:aromatic-ring-hydroxylating dioxygenase subunit beta n=1 Tax=Mycolicibacterium novocastrense TaxID=59813 RepID=UPI000747848A|nr:aromatic-ring-hydroxylating dioxygenase subunit beta [Mycolicibacterium novocastrense]KUH68072.1 hypothetical protein AU183_04460 [Mycolicibacterium novocastrense]KUH68681.1 hypothetical protein AU184_26670 [Mycolicibacterium novocastrense]KUH74378.1 hypothetical protein AU072_17295 [Mycolicibacterium novocastrense]